MQIDFPELDDPLLVEIARLWNSNAAGRHAFFPWTGALLGRLLRDERGRAVGAFAVARGADGELAGFVHFNQVLEEGYPNAGVIEGLLVDSGHRRRGIGGALLEAALGRIRGFLPRPVLVDAMGAWPFGYGFNTLADGSERSGVFVDEPGLYRLFRRAGFLPVRESRVMRVETALARMKPTPVGAGFYIARRTDRTWLDRVFRGRELWDHELARYDGRVLSRAIFGLMDGESHREKRAIFGVFGVNTPHDFQKKGYASANISQMLAHIRSIGGEVAELHVYADNEAALALYEGVGFKTVAQTVMLHKPLE